MKNYGIVTEYNGFYGNIKGVDAIDYRFLKEDIVKKDETFEKNKHVEFESQKITKQDFTFYRANYVKVLQKKQTEEKQR